ncbi:MAG: Gldg family protein [Chitinophagales bacterium]
MLTKGGIRLRVLLVLAIIILLNFLVSQYFLRLDFTGDKRYTLSQATKDILKELDETVTVTAYFSEDMPPNLERIKTSFEDMLTEYSNRSGGNIEYKFVNPNESEELEQEAMKEGMQPGMVNMRERDQMKQQRVYLGAKFSYKDQSEVIPIISQEGAMEYAMSSAIKKISATNKPKIGFVGGHGEAGLDAMQQVKETLDVLYNAQTALLSDTALVTDFETLVIVAPKDTISPAELANLDKFVNAGKGVLIALNRVNADLQTGSGTEVYTGLETWLESKGITVNPNFVMDVNSGSITMQRQQGFFTINEQVKFPYLPLIKNFSDHPITKGLEQLILPFASSITYTATDTEAKFTPIAYTSDRSGMAQPPITFDATTLQKEWTAADFPTSRLTIAGVWEKGLSKMVVYGDGDFAVNGIGQQAQGLQPDNINFLANGIDWLSDDTGLTDLRNKVVTSRPIQKELSDSERSFVKYGNFFLPIFLIVFYGFIRSQIRNRRKMKWMSEKYG